MSKSTDSELAYSINSLKGRIGQAIMEIILRRSGYEVYPYGYEYHFAQIVQSMAKQNADETVQMVRSTPDFYVFDGSLKEGFVVEVKMSYVADESHYLHDKQQIDRYLKFWPRAYLVIVCAKSLNFYVQRFDQLGRLLRSVNGKAGAKEQYKFDLKANFLRLPATFKRINPDTLVGFRNMIYHDVFRQISEDIDVEATIA